MSRDMSELCHGTGHLQAHLIENYSVLLDKTLDDQLTIFTIQKCLSSSFAAKDKDVRVGGGAQTIQQFMELGILDEIHLAQIPIKLQSGEALFTNRDLQLRHYREGDSLISGSVTHQTYIRN